MKLLQLFSFPRVSVYLACAAVYMLLCELPADIHPTKSYGFAFSMLFFIARAHPASAILHAFKISYDMYAHSTSYKPTRLLSGY